MTAGEFMKNVVSNPQGSYLFFGDEEYTKLSCLSRLRVSLFGEAADDPFNHHKIVCTESGWEERLTNAIDTLPVFAEKKLVELHSLSFPSLSDAQLSALISLFAQANDGGDTVLAVYTLSEEINVGRLPKAPSALYKKLTAVLNPVQCDRQTPGRLTGWVGRHFTAEGVTASAMVCQEIVEKCGTDMFTLSNEIKKLAFYTLSKDEKAVSLQDIDLVCCVSKESGAFDFTNAILDGNAPRALELLIDMRQRKEKPEIVLAGIIDTLANLYTVKRLIEAGKKPMEMSADTGLHEYRVKLYSQSASGKSSKRLQKALTLCSEADQKIKSTSLDNYTVLEILILRLSRM